MSNTKRKELSSLTREMYIMMISTRPASCERQRAILNTYWNVESTKGISNLHALHGVAAAILGDASK